jgi:hypothetical protein
MGLPRSPGEGRALVDPMHGDPSTLSLAQTTAEGRAD